MRECTCGDIFRNLQGLCMFMMYTSECECVHGSPNSHEYVGVGMGVSVRVGTVAGWSLGKCECWHREGG